MEVIHIDSSDDEVEIPSSSARGVGSGGFAVSGVGASPAAAAARTRLVTQDSRESNDNNSSVSSGDSIWDEPGLKSSSRSRKASNGDILKSDDELEVVVGGGYKNNNVEVLQQESSAVKVTVDCNPHPLSS